MSEIIIDVDEPEVIVEEAYSTDYDLPIASASTLGGVKIGENIEIANDGKISVPIASETDAGVVKVGTNLSIDEDGVLSAIGGSTVTIDSVLSTVSTNPVQNKVITSNLAAANATISALSSTVSSHTSTLQTQQQSINTLESNVSTYSTAITNLQSNDAIQDTNISGNSSAIADNTSDIAALEDRMDDVEDAITTLNNGTSELSGNVNTLLTTTHETINYSDIANIWTNGNISINGKGKIAFVEFNLEGSVQVAAQNDYLLYTIGTDALKPVYLAHGMVITDAGVLDCQISTTGNIRLYNLSASTYTITKLKGCVPIILS